MLSCRKTTLAVRGLAVALLLLPVTVRAAEPDKFLPNDSEMVMGLNVKQMINSPVVKKYALDQIKIAMMGNADVQKFLKALDFDPLTDVDSMLVSASNLANPNNKVLIVVRGKFDQAKIQKAVENSQNKVKTSKEGDLTIYESEQNANTSFFTVMDAGTIVMSNQKAYLVDASKAKGGKLSKPLVAALETVEGKDSMWMAVEVTEAIRKQMANNPQAKQIAPTLDAVTMSVNLTNDAGISLSVLTNNGDAATQLRMMAGQIKPILTLLSAQAGDEEIAGLLKTVIDTIKIGGEKNTVSMTAKITDEIIGKAIKKAMGGQ